MMGFQFGIKDVIDILLVAMLLYQAFRLLRRTGATNLFWGIFGFIIAWFLVSFVFQLELTGALFDRIISVGAIALIVIFQGEIRTFFYRIGAGFSRFQLLSLRGENNGKDNEPIVREIALACSHMAKSKTGALIVLTGDNQLREYTDTGEQIDAAVSARMIENIFFKNTPLHDGALFISSGRMVAAACILPVSKSTTLPQQYGLRHRAAVGLTEKTDATCIVVSEETGKISIARADSIRTVSEDELLQYLRTSLSAA